VKRKRLKEGRKDGKIIKCSTSTETSAKKKEKKILKGHYILLLMYALLYADHCTKNKSLTKKKGKREEVRERNTEMNPIQML
jgi:hypothetical protein